MTLHLSDACLDAPYSAVTITDEIPDIWITSLFDLKGMTNPIHRAVVPSMYRAIPKETICASIWKEGKIIATGLGILDRDYIGIYAIHVKENYRGQGFARQICTALLTEGMKKVLKMPIFRSFREIPLPNDCMHLLALLIFIRIGSVCSLKL